LAQNTDQAARVALQPLAQQVRQMEEALSFLGQPLPAADAQRIRAALGQPDEAAAVAELGRVLDQYALAIVTINAESRVKVEVGRRSRDWSKEERGFFWSRLLTELE